jgi:hypothetical protein
VAGAIERTPRIGRLILRTVLGCHRDASQAIGRIRSPRELVVARHSIHRLDRFGLQQPIRELALPTLKEFLDSVANSPTLWSVDLVGLVPFQPDTTSIEERVHGGDIEL